MVKPTADDARGDSPDGNVPNGSLGPAAALPPAVRQPEGRHNPRKNTEGVSVDAQRAKVKAGPSGCRDGRHHGVTQRLLYKCGDHEVAFSFTGVDGVSKPELNSLASAPTAGTPPSRRAATRAVPTMTPSA